MEWKPIETLPDEMRNGTEILVWDPKYAEYPIGACFIAGYPVIYHTMPLGGGPSEPVRYAGGWYIFEPRGNMRMEDLNPTHWTAFNPPEVIP